MTEMEAPSIDTQTKKQTESEHVESTLREAEEKSKDIAEEALKRAALELTQDVSDYVNEEKKKRSFGNAIKEWFTTQISHISQAVIALMIATILALVTPLLVKFELMDELQELGQNLSTQLDKRNTQNILASSLDISDTTAKLTRQTDGLRTAFEGLNEKLNNSNAEITASLTKQEQRIAQLVRDQNKKIDELRVTIISQRPNTQNSDATNIVQAQYPRRLETKLNQYISQGRSLLKQDDLDTQEVNAWVGEVYFFISLIPSNQDNLDSIKSNLEQIHIRAKPFNDDTDRVTHTLIILNALNGWITL